MRRAAGAGDDDLEAAPLRRGRIIREPFRGAVGRDNPALVRNTEAVQDGAGVLHRLPIRRASHDDADDGFLGGHGCALLPFARLPTVRPPRTDSVVDLASGS